MKLKTGAEIEAQCIRIMHKASERARIQISEIGTCLEVMSSEFTYMTNTELSRHHFAKIKLTEISFLLQKEARKRIILRRGIKINC